MTGGSDLAGNTGEAALAEEPKCGGGTPWPKAGEAGGAWKEGSVCSSQGSRLLLQCDVDACVLGSS